MNYHWYYFSWFRDLSRSSNMINRFVLCMLAFSFKLSCQKLYTSLKRLLVIELLFLKASIILRKYIYLDDCSICYNNKFLLPVATHEHDASKSKFPKILFNPLESFISQTSLKALAFHLCDIGFLNFSFVYYFIYLFHSNSRWFSTS
jgi:hypothetical protein